MEESTSSGGNPGPNSGPVVPGWVKFRTGQLGISLYVDLSNFGNRWYKWIEEIHGFRNLVWMSLCDG